MNDPKFLIVVSLDEPKGIAETGGYATAGMVAAPSVKTHRRTTSSSLYGILPGDLNGGPAAIEIASTPVAASPPPPPPQFVSANARHRAGARRKALPARRPSQTADTRQRRECVALLLSELMRAADAASPCRAIRCLPA